MKDKKNFEAPDLEITCFTGEDILSTSGGIELPDDEW